MKGRLLLDVVITQCSTILQLLSSENESLLIWGNAESGRVRDEKGKDPKDSSPLFVLDLRFHIVNCVRRLHL